MIPIEFSYRLLLVHSPKRNLTAQRPLRQIHCAGTGNERGSVAGFMTVLEALAILEAATLECKKREVDTPELQARSIFWSRTFDQHGSFRNFAITSTVSVNINTVREKVNNKYFALRFPVSEI